MAYQYLNNAISRAYLRSVRVPKSCTRLEEVETDIELVTNGRHVTLGVVSAHLLSTTMMSLSLLSHTLKSICYSSTNFLYTPCLRTTISPFPSLTFGPLESIQWCRSPLGLILCATLGDDKGKATSTIMATGDGDDAVFSMKLVRLSP